MLTGNVLTVIRIRVINLFTGPPKKLRARAFSECEFCRLPVPFSEPQLNLCQGRSSQGVGVAKRCVLGVQHFAQIEYKYMQKNIYACKYRIQTYYIQNTGSTKFPWKSSANGQWLKKYAIKNWGNISNAKQERGKSERREKRQRDSDWEIEEEGKWGDKSKHVQWF